MQQQNVSYIILQHSSSPEFNARQAFGSICVQSNTQVPKIMSVISVSIQFLLLSCTTLSAAETITGYIYCDNYFEFYFNGQQVGVDPLDFTPHNAVKVSFDFDETSGQSKTYAILCQDYASTSGYEYTSSSPQLGDGALLAEFSDGTKTGPQWKSYVVTFGPTDASISNGCAASNLSPCVVQDNGVPQNWQNASFDDSAWSFATEYTAAEAGWGRKPSYSNGQCGTIMSPVTRQTASPSSVASTADQCLDPRSVLCGGDETCSGSDPRFIWGSDMDRDNKMLFRYTVSGSSDSSGSSTTSAFTSSTNGVVSGAHFPTRGLISLLAVIVHLCANVRVI